MKDTRSRNVIAIRFAEGDKTYRAPARLEKAGADGLVDVHAAVVAERRADGATTCTGPPGPTLPSARSSGARPTLHNKMRLRTHEHPLVRPRSWACSNVWQRMIHRHSLRQRRPSARPGRKG
jgi:hypothetical protein